MRTLLFILFSLPLLCGAQITIDASHMPTVDYVFPYANTADIGLIDPSITGEDMTWDYSLLMADSYMADTFQTVEATPFAYQFFFNNGLLYPEHNANHSRPTFAGTLGPVEVDNSYAYYKTSDTEYSEVGIGTTFNNLPSSIRNLPVDVIYEFPLEMGDEYDGFSTQELELPTQGYYYGEQFKTTVVEGWGTLILPGEMAYEVLKLRVTINGTDSLYSEQFSTGFLFPRPETTVYQWVSQEEGRPVLEVTSIDGAPSSAQYRANDPALSISDLRIPGVSTYPNPTSDWMRIDGEGMAKLTFELLDMNGRSVQLDVQQSDRAIVADVSALENGVYIIRLSHGSASWTQQLIKQ